MGIVNIYDFILRFCFIPLSGDFNVKLMLFNVDGGFDELAAWVI